MDVSTIQTVTPQSVAILGSTGSIGKSTLSVIALHPEKYRVQLLSANTNVTLMLEQCRTFKPSIAVMQNADAAQELHAQLQALGLDTQVLQGETALCDCVSNDTVDIVVAAIVGAAGLMSTLAAASSGKRVLLANKEALVMSGSLLMSRASASGALIMPTDSEHNAIFQCLADHKLTKMMNKGLEVIEACTLFSLELSDIDVLIHPESVVHSMVQYRDGSVLAQLGRPDMRTPIAHALAWPERINAGVEPLNFQQITGLHFEEPDLNRFPCLRLAFEAQEAGGTAPTVLNAANEIAVAGFLDGSVSFLQLAQLVEDTLGDVKISPASDLTTIIEADKQARELAQIKLSKLLE